MKSASGKRPPDEAHGPGKEAIRPQQRCLGKARKEGAHWHAALSAGVETALIQKINACDARHVPGWCKEQSALQIRVGTAKDSSFFLFFCFAPRSKILLNFVKHFRMFSDLLCFYCNSGPKFNNFDDCCISAICMEKIKIT